MESQIKLLVYEIYYFIGFYNKNHQVSDGDIVLLTYPIFFSGYLTLMKSDELMNC